MSIAIIRPRRGITAQEIAEFLTEQFQQPGQCDGNPLINAEITYTAEMPNVVSPEEQA